LKIKTIKKIQLLIEGAKKEIIKKIKKLKDNEVVKAVEKMKNARVKVSRNNE